MKNQEKLNLLVGKLSKKSLDTQFVNLQTGESIDMQDVINDLKEAMVVLDILKKDMWINSKGEVCIYPSPDVNVYANMEFVKEWLKK